MIGVTVMFQIKYSVVKLIFSGNLPWVGVVTIARRLILNCGWFR